MLPGIRLPMPARFPGPPLPGSCKFRELPNSRPTGEPELSPSHQQTFRDPHQHFVLGRNPRGSSQQRSLRPPDSRTSCPTDTRCRARPWDRSGWPSPSSARPIACAAAVGHSHPADPDGGGGSASTLSSRESDGTGAPKSTKRASSNSVAFLWGCRSPLLIGCNCSRLPRLNGSPARRAPPPPPRLLRLESCESRRAQVLGATCARIPLTAGLSGLAYDPTSAAARSKRQSGGWWQLCP